VSSREKRKRNKLKRYFKIPEEKAAEEKPEAKNSPLSGPYGIGIPVSERSHAGSDQESLWHYFVVALHFFMGFLIWAAIAAIVIYLFYKFAINQLG